jgi:hypothetical protein
MNKNKHTDLDDDLDDDLDHEGINRRQFLGRLGATTLGGGAAYYGGTEYAGSPVQNGQAVIPVAIGAAVVGGAAIGYATRYVADKHLGDDFDETAYDEAAVEELHAEIRENALERSYYDDSMLTNLNNVLANSKQVAYGDARVAAIEQMNLGNTEQDAIDAGVEVVDDFFAVQQENLLEHYNFQAENFSRQINAVKSAGLFMSEIFHSPDVYEHFYTLSAGTTSKTLVNGTNYDYSTFYYEYRDSSGTKQNTTASINDPIRVQVKPVSTGSKETFFDLPRFDDTLSKISTNHSETVSEITNFVNTVYPEYQAGDISLEDIVRPSELADKASDSEENPLSGADLAIMGLEANTQSKTTVRLVDDDIVLQGSLYLKSESGPSLEVGQTYSPSSFTGPVYLAYSNYSGDNPDLKAQGVITVDQQFELTQAIGSDGAELATVEYTSEDGQKTTTTDTAELKEELDRLNELQTELQEEQKEIAADSGGGGGGIDLSAFSAFGFPGEVVGLGVAGLAAYFYSK